MLGLPQLSVVLTWTQHEFSIKQQDVSLLNEDTT